MSHDPIDCRPPDSSVQGILQARILEWVAIPFSRGSSQHRAGNRSPAVQADSVQSEPPAVHICKSPPYGGLKLKLKTLISQKP